MSGPSPPFARVYVSAPESHLALTFIREALLQGCEVRTNIDTSVPLPAAGGRLGLGEMAADFPGKLQYSHGTQQEPQIQQGMAGCDALFLCDILFRDLTTVEIQSSYRFRVLRAARAAGIMKIIVSGSVAPAVRASPPLSANQIQSRYGPRDFENGQTLRLMLHFIRQHWTAQPLVLPIQFGILQYDIIWGHLRGLWHYDGESSTLWTMLRPGTHLYVTDESSVSGSFRAALRRFNSVAVPVSTAVADTRSTRVVFDGLRTLRLTLILAGNVVGYVGAEQQMPTDQGFEGQFQRAFDLPERFRGTTAWNYH